MTDDGKLIEWLLEGDPAIRWQVMRDLVGASKETIATERHKVATEGWSARLLSCQDASGMWGGQLYNRKWLSTTYTLLLLRQMGLEANHPQAYLACKLLLNGGFKPNGGLSYAKTVDVIDNGVTGMVLSILAYFGYPDHRLHAIAGYLCDQQLSDGGWEPVPGDQHLRYKFDATLLILDGLHEYEQQFPGRSERVAAAQRRGREFLLHHRLYHLPQSEQIIDKKMLLFSFPPRWHFDVLASLDYFQACRMERDERLSAAIELLVAKRNQNGSWDLQNRHAGKTFFEMEEVGKPSRWNTLRALRVLEWWQGN